jgi:hypothetical protein
MSIRKREAQTRNSQSFDEGHLKLGRYHKLDAIKLDDKLCGCATGAAQPFLP